MRNNFDLISELIDNRLAAISNKADREQLFFFVFFICGFCFNGCEADGVVVQVAFFCGFGKRQ